MSTQNRILYLSHTSKTGGAEFVLSRLFKTMDRDRFLPIVVLAEEGPFQKLLEEVEVETHVYPLDASARMAKRHSLGASSLLKNPLRLVHSATAVIRYAICLARFAREHDVDLIHTNSMKSHVYGGLAGLMARVPVVWHMHNHLQVGYMQRSAARTMHFLARLLPDRVIAVSESVREELQLPARSEKGVVVHNGLLDSELSTFSEAKAAASLRTDEITRIGLIGRITPWKGQHVFLQAAERLVKEGRSSLHFQIIGAPLFGEEEYETELHQLVQDAGISSHVEFTGYRDDIPTALAELDILVNPSTIPEPFGGVIQEGMAAGVPVIGTNGGGTPEMIKHGETGLLATMDDVDSLVRQLQSLIDNPDLAKCIAQDAQTRAQQHFTATRMAREIQEVYESIIVKHNNATSR